MYLIINIKFVVKLSIINDSYSSISVKLPLLGIIYVPLYPFSEVITYVYMYFAAILSLQDQ